MTAATVAPPVALPVALPRLAVVLALAGLTLAACATRPAAVPTPGTSPATPVRPGPPTPPGPPLPVGASPASLPGWGDEDHLAAFQAYVAGCGAARDPAGRSVCAEARRMAERRVSPSDARTFFETRFFVSPAETSDGGPGLLTSYFAPEYAARHRPDGEFDAPVLAAPAQPRSAGSRTAIEAGARPEEALAWMRAEDLFFLQIQGSGYLTFEDGTKARAAYAADNGQTFVGIARPMAERGLLPRNGTSGDAIRAWLAEHRGAEARAVMALNPRYIFFRLDPDDGGDPAGAAGVPLTARRAIAVDPANWRYGELAWVEADGGNLRGASASYRGLVMALDTGSAIKGPVRADLYMGRGDVAGAEAGTVRHPLRMWRLVPRG
ncbi:MAG: murein transglycosylase [Brevundimonas sp.]|uniref:peptidoglycan lytic exotransglycosylase n=2 Tax=Brevundimonas albigilva TaxID=1312364 RepID=A0ABY4SJD7_9CAUL|nr:MULTISPECIES: MltA domain-containing protein [Brevundimonas]PZU52325.1 MAG: murein transglycosylase [Brevundimonas sp.]URI15087.1 MltA domain-containing protein [Brevundimonas albigilva]